VLPAVRSSPCKAPCRRPSQKDAAWGCSRRNLDRLGGCQRSGDPAQHVIEAAAGERCGVEEALEQLRGLGGVETRSRVAVSGGHGSFDGPSGERLGAALGHERVDAAADRVPHHLWQAGHEAERVKDERTAATGGPRPNDNNRSVDLRQRHHRGPGRVEERRERAGPGSCPSPAVRSHRRCGPTAPTVRRHEARSPDRASSRRRPARSCRKRRVIADRPEERHRRPGRITLACPRRARTAEQ